MLLDLPEEVLEVMLVSLAESCADSPWEVGMKHALWASLSCSKLLLLDVKRDDTWEKLTKKKFPYVAFFENLCACVGWKNTFLQQWKANASSPRLITAATSNFFVGDMLLIMSVRRANDVLTCSSHLLSSEDEFEGDRLHFQFLRPSNLASLEGCSVDLFLVYVGFDGTTVRLANGELEMGMKLENTEVVEFLTSMQEGDIVPSVSIFLDPQNLFAGGLLHFDFHGEAACLGCVTECLFELFF